MYGYQPNIAYVAVVYHIDTCILAATTYQAPRAVGRPCGHQAANAASQWCRLPLRESGFPRPSTGPGINLPQASIFFRSKPDEAAAVQVMTDGRSSVDCIRREQL